MTRGTFNAIHFKPAVLLRTLLYRGAEPDLKPHSVLQLLPERELPDPALPHHRPLKVLTPEGLRWRAGARTDPCTQLSPNNGHGPVAVAHSHIPMQLEQRMHGRDLCARIEIEPQLSDSEDEP